jgi:RNA-directed DNA polymerase
MFRKQRRPLLIDQVCAPENLADAWGRVRRNIRVRDRASSRGADGQSIEDFECHLEANLAHLARQLQDGTYRPRPVQRFLLPKRGGGARTISVLAVRDRVAQRAVQNVIEPLFEARFLDCSYGFRPGRSVADAVARLLAYRQAGCTWVLDADVQDCFDSLDHRLLMRFVRPVVREPAIWRLIQAWLDAGVMGALADEVAHERRSVPWDGLLDAAARHLDTALDWGLRHLVGQEDGLPYDVAVPVDGSVSSLDPEAVRRRALGRLGREALVLGLSFSRPLVERARRSLPEWGKALRRRNVALAALASLGVALLPLAYKALSADEGGQDAAGTPQGSVLSPLLANVYLNQFDRAMVRRGFCLVRYADDWCIVGRSRTQVERAQEAAERALARLKLSLNEEKTRILRLDEGFVFLGSRFQADGVHTPATEGRWGRLRGRVRRAANRAGGRARQVSQRAVRAARQQGGQLAGNARRTARGIADDLRRVRLFDGEKGHTTPPMPHHTSEAADREGTRGNSVSDGTGLDPEQN